MDDLIKTIGETLQNKYRTCYITIAEDYIKFYPNADVPAAGIKFVFLPDGTWCYDICHLYGNHYHGYDHQPFGIKYHISSPDMFEEMFRLCNIVIKFKNTEPQSPMLLSHLLAPHD